jgi:hypothetical protein
MGNSSSSKERKREKKVHKLGLDRELPKQKCRLEDFTILKVLNKNDINMNFPSGGGSLLLLPHALDGWAW